MIIFPVFIISSGDSLQPPLYLIYIYFGIAEKEVYNIYTIGWADAARTAINVDQEGKKMDYIIRPYRHGEEQYVAELHKKLYTEEYSCGRQALLLLRYITMRR